MLFESLVVRDLRVFAQALGGRVLHYRDNTGLALGVIVGTGYGYVRDDGIAVIPAGALGP